MADVLNQSVCQPKLPNILVKKIRKFLFPALTPEIDGTHLVEQFDHNVREVNFRKWLLFDLTLD